MDTLSIHHVHTLTLTGYNTKRQRIKIKSKHNEWQRNFTLHSNASGMSQKDYKTKLSVACSVAV